MPPKTVVFLLILAALFLATPCEAQWGFYTSTRDAFVLYRQGQRGLFFSEKDPEEQEVTLGPVVVRPGLAVSETWTTNLTLAPAGAEEDFYTQLFPALQLRLPHKRNLFEVEYLGNFAWYSNNAQFNVDDHYFRAHAQVELIEDSMIQIESLTALLYTPVEDVRLYIPEYSYRRRVNYYQNRVAFNPASYKRFSVMVDYDNSIARFQQAGDQGDDYDRNAPGILMGYSILRRTRLLLGYKFLDYNSRQPFPSSDYHEHSVIFGLEWRMPHSLQLNLRASYNWDFYTDIDLEPQLWGARMSLRYEPLKRLTLEAHYERFSRPTMTFSGDRYNPLTDTLSVYYIEDRANLSCQYEFRDNLLLWLTFVYKRLDYPPDGRQGTDRLDNIYGGTAQVIYTFRPWLRFSLAGGYARDDSTEMMEDYEAVTGQLYVQCAF